MVQAATLDNEFDLRHQTEHLRLIVFIIRILSTKDQRF